jgi:hypothetical protein
MQPYCIKGDWHMLKIIKYHYIPFCYFAVFILSTHAAYAESITLTWNASEPGRSDVSGYKIYYSTESGNYTYPPIDAGNVTSYTINDLDENKIYYISVTSYSSAGEESKFSSEVSTFNEFTGTAQIFSGKMQWGSCEIEDEPGDTVQVYLSFNYLPAQGNFMFEPDDTRISCNEGTFIQHDDNTIEATCVKKGRLGLVTLYRFIFEGFGNASLRDSLSLNAEMFIVLNQACPVYVVKMEDLLPVQE